VCVRCCRSPLWPTKSIGSFARASSEDSRPTSLTNSPSSPETSNKHVPTDHTLHYTTPPHTHCTTIPPHTPSSPHTHPPTAIASNALFPTDGTAPCEHCRHAPPSPHQSTPRRPAPPTTATADYRAATQACRQRQEGQQQATMPHLLRRMGAWRPSPRISLPTRQRRSGLMCGWTRPVCCTCGARAGQSYPTVHTLPLTPCHSHPNTHV
jgi:hypothetical protein